MEWFRLLGNAIMISAILILPIAFIISFLIGNTHYMVFTGFLLLFSSLYIISSKHDLTD